MSTTPELQRQILAELAKNPFASRQQLADSIGKSVSSLNQVIPVLKRQGALREGMMVESSWNPLQKFFIFIETRPPAGALSDPKYQRSFVNRIQSVIEHDERYNRSLVLEDIEIVMGADWDIIAVFRANHFKHIATFVTEFLRLQPEVGGTRTSQVLLSEGPGRDDP